MKQGKNDGQMKTAGQEKFAQPASAVPGPIEGMSTGMENLGDKAGFQTSGYIDKKGTAYGEAAKFNCLPPGMDIDHQETSDIRSMKMKQVTDMSYPGDGWSEHNVE
jgi:hypothetical protein